MGNPARQQGRKIPVYTRGEKILRFSTEITVYLGNGTIYAHGLKF